MPVEICVVVPVFNEEENILPLAREVAEAFTSQPQSFELLFIDDASTDETWERILEARHQDPRVRGVRHRVNAGQSAAFLTGLRASETPIVATLDGDRQNNPADLPRMVTALDEVDFVCAVRVARQDTWVRRLSSRLARWARHLVFRADFRDTGCFLRVFRRSALVDVMPFNGWHRFLPVLVHADGVSVKEIEVQHRPRVAGLSKYGIWNRLPRGLWDLIGVSWVLQRRLRPITTTESDRTA